MAVGFIYFYVIILVRGAVPAAAGALHHEDIAGGHLRLIEGAELGALSAHAEHVVAPRLARLAAGHAVRPYEPVAGENRRRHRLEKTHAPDRARAAAPAPLPARAMPDLE